ncbi:MAG: glutamate--tRNA ligase [Bacteroidetes bacterium]|nr:MAG: glutamate--tRNA ligase [Bacteroidota bacterium]
MDRKVRVRFAPSPTGPLHIGGVRTALYNYLFAKRNNGDFILRIEDTDQTRYVEGAEKYILNSLEWCGIKCDEGVEAGGEFGPYRQSERKEMYRQYVEQLVDNDCAYYAFDTPEELDEMRQKLKSAKVPSPQYNAVTRSSMKNSLTLSEDKVKELLDKNTPYVVRIKVPRKEEIKIKDIIRGWVVFHSSQVDDKVLFKSDGMPTYHLANVVDDHLMEISHVIRGEEWLPSTPVHVLLYKYLGWEGEMPEFAHLPLILKPDGNGKLSKRDGDKLGFPVFPLEWINPENKERSSGFKDDGYFPQSFLNMLVLLGWHPSDDKELFTLDELISEFSLERVTKSGAKFDPDKAKWFNQQYLKSYDDKELAKMVQPALQDKGIANDEEFISNVCGLVKERMSFINDFWEHASYFFEKPKSYDEKVVRKKWKENIPEVVVELKSVFLNLQSFKADEIEQAFKHFVESKGLPIGALMPVLRLLVSGVGFGPPLFEMAELLGKEEVIARIETGINELEPVS